MRFFDGEPTVIAVDEGALLASGINAGERQEWEADFLNKVSEGIRALPEDAAKISRVERFRGLLSDLQNRRYER